MKTVLITGANKGIGFASAKLFLEKGYNVIISGRNEERLKTAVEKLGSKNCAYVVWDIAKVSTNQSAIEKAHQIFGDISVFVNNAGIVADEDISFVPFFEKTEKSWDETMDINLKGAFFALQAQMKYMVNNSIKGSIVNLCSEMAFRPAENAYCISKWGVRGMISGVAKIGANYGIVVNGIAPGETATEILRQKEGEPHKINSPRGERAMPSEIAEAIVFLAESKNIIGEILVSDGGRRLR